MSRHYKIPIATLHNWFNKKGILRRLFLVKRLRTRDSYKIGLFIGMWAGDGSKAIGKNGLYVVRFHFNSEDVYCHNLTYDLIENLFGSKINVVRGPGKKFEIKTYSIFIYKFLSDYLTCSNDKCGTVKLKFPISGYSDRFLLGFISGLAITDGHFGKCFVFTTVSTGLKKQFVYVLRKFGFNPKEYLQRRKEPTWRPAWKIRLIVAESEKFANLIGL